MHNFARPQDAFDISVDWRGEAVIMFRDSLKSVFGGQSCLPWELWKRS